MTSLPTNGERDETAGEGEASAVERLDPSRTKSRVTLSRPAEELPRELTSKYRLDSLIAVGGMGRVYAGTQLALGRKVAIKVLTAQGAGDDFRRRFLLEASVSARLTHRNIVTVHDYGETASGELFMVMELLEGEPLTSLLARERRLSPSRACHIAIEVCRALRAAHRESVAHRDLKPGNVMILRGEEEGDAERVKVLDFGLVKVFQDAQEGALERDLTQGETMLGSPRYMAPEQILCEPADNRTDIYSLGVVLFAMLAGELPFIAKGPVQVLQQHLHTSAPTLAERMIRLEGETEPPALPSELETIVQRCLEKAQDDRYQTVDELSRALAQVYGGLTGLSSEGSTMFALESADASGRRGAITPSLTPTPGPAPSPLSAEPARSRAWIAVVVALLLAGVGAVALMGSGEEADEPVAPAVAPAATRVVLTSQPPGAEVRLGGRSLGTTPTERSLEASVVGERIELEFVLAGHRAARVPATLRGAEVAVHIALRPLPPPEVVEPAAPPPVVEASAPEPEREVVVREPPRRSSRQVRRRASERAAEPTAPPERPAQRETPRSRVLIEDEAHRASVPVVD